MSMKSKWINYKCKLKQWYRKNKILASFRQAWYHNTNTSAINALAILERGTDGKIYSCPECKDIFVTEDRLSDHLSIIHGYPRDMDVAKYLQTEVKKANPKYLEYL